MKDYCNSFWEQLFSFIWRLIIPNAQFLCYKLRFTNGLRLFSHESKVRYLNCAFWITQCTHERSNCDIWITQCTHERPNLGFSIPEREKNVWVPCQSNMHGARISCASVHMQCVVYRRKWLEGHLAPPPQKKKKKSQFRGQDIYTVISLCDLRDANWKTPPDRHLKCAHFKWRIVM